MDFLFIAKFWSSLLIQCTNFITNKQLELLNNILQNSNLFGRFSFWKSKLMHTSAIGHQVAYKSLVMIARDQDCWIHLWEIRTISHRMDTGFLGKTGWWITGQDHYQVKLIFLHASSVKRHEIQNFFRANCFRRRGKKICSRRNCNLSLRGEF